MLLEYRGKITAQWKLDQNIVTEVDRASERMIIEMIDARHPGCNIIGEEGGYQNRSSEITWVIDPLDGTSNYVKGLPWFGVLMTILHNGVPVQAVMYLPTSDTMYVAEDKKGVYRNGKPVSVSTEDDFSKTVCSCLTNDQWLTNRLDGKIGMIGSTNSLLDYCYTVDGRTGAFYFDQSSCSIWDIAPLPLMLKEAGGVLSDGNGKDIKLDLSIEACKVKYSVLGANENLHTQIMQLLID